MGARAVELPVGVSDFRKLIDYRDPNSGEPYSFLDKSLLIKDIIKESAEVILLTRPRRFGKTLNMSMLHHFFAKEVNGQSTEHLFNHLKITEYQFCMARQGKYPVIYLTFKGINSKNYDLAYSKLRETIAFLYAQHNELLSSPKLSSREKTIFGSIINEQATKTHLSNSLKELTYYLYLHYGVKPIVLIDEYDTPVKTGYIKGYYQDIVDFMGTFLGEGLKDNPYLEKGVLTGILRVSTEGLFTGLNNLETYSLLSSNYGQYFGFTEAEVEELLRKADLSQELAGVRQWYNGYQCGNVVVYNPWSIISFVKHKEFQPYWVNTSDNSLVKSLLIESNTNFKAQFALLLQGKSIEMPIKERMIFSDLAKGGSNVWTLLLMAGYLKASVIRKDLSNPLCHLQIPNNEVKDFYENIIIEWLSGENDLSVFNVFISDFLNGNIASFESYLRKIMMETISVHDIHEEQAEIFYHAFFLGLIAGIGKDYKLSSNRESGLGRFDILVSPCDPTKLGIILEIKSLPKGKGTSEDTLEKLEQAAQSAIQQIKAKQYNMALIQDGVQQCLNIGIAFRGKEFAMAHGFEDLAR